MRRRIFVAFVAALALSACASSTPEERAQQREALMMFGAVLGGTSQGLASAERTYQPPAAPSRGANM